MTDFPTLYCNLAQPEGKRKEPPPFAVCPQCPWVIEDIHLFGKSVRDRTTDEAGRVVECVRAYDARTGGR